MDATATEKPKAQEKKPISKHEFFFESALYKEFKKGEIEPDWWKGEVEAYNPTSHKDTTYAIRFEEMSQFAGRYPNLYKVTLTCKRDSDLELYFFIYNDGEKIYKCGQEPSLADIQYAKIGRNYDKLLSENDLKELKRAIGLAAHGAGIASYVHLRRIFENLIHETFTAHKDTLGITDEVFLQKRMAERVDALKAFLPSQLVEMQVIYGILSKGIHELDEKECLQFFPAIELAVILVLEQKVEMETKRKRDEDAKSLISAINAQVGKKA